MIALCYLIGSIPFSYLISRLKGVDIRTKGSGNVGATNVFRTLGPGVAAAALTGDLLKGVLAAWIGAAAGGGWLVAACAVAAVAGHCFPVFLGFRGGKGVATSAGVILYLFPIQLLILLAVFVVLVLLLRWVSLASVTAAVMFPILILFSEKPLHLIILSLLMAVMVVYRHRENIERLRNGTEPKLGQRA